MNNLNKFLFLCIALIAIGSVSCNNDKPQTNYDEYTDARIIRFNLQKSDTLFSGWTDVFFSIDQIKGEVYNNDSLPVGTKVNKLLTQIEYISASKVEYKKLTLTLDNEVQEWKEYKNTDSLDFTTPLVFKVTALDEITTKEYVIRVNVHKQDPNLLSWQKITSDRLPVNVQAERSVLVGNKLYTLAKTQTGNYSLFVYSDFTQIENQFSALALPIDIDFETLTATDQTIWVSSLSGGLYKFNGNSFDLITPSVPVKLIGWIADAPAYKARLILQSISPAMNRFITYKTESNEWVNTNHPIPYGFPMTGYGKTGHKVDKSTRLTLIGGTFNGAPTRKVFQFTVDKDTLQCSEDLLSSVSPSRIPLRETTGNSAFIYDNRMFVFEGYPFYKYTETIDKTEVEITTNRFVYSKDFGITWSASSSNESLPKTMPLRSNSSIVIDKNNFLWIIGGVDKDGNNLNDLWKGRINRLGFIIQ